MNLEKEKLNPNSVNDREAKKKTTENQTMNRRGFEPTGKKVNPRQIPTTLGYAGKRMSR